jgi:hypothetical protein
MRTATLVFIILCASVALANTHEWKDAKVVDITSESGGTAAIPVSGMVARVPITKTFYRIQTADTTYVLGPAITKNQMLNVTLHGKTKIYTDGHNAHILDDDGKDKKIPISEKIARTEEPAEVPAKP